MADLVFDLCIPAKIICPSDFLNVDGTLNQNHTHRQCSFDTLETMHQEGITILIHSHTVSWFGIIIFQALRDDIEASQFDLDEVHQTGEQLMSLCGEPDRPEVQKNIDDLDNNLLTITGEFDKRSRTLEEALERSMYFQEELMVIMKNIFLLFFKKTLLKTLYWCFWHYLLF